MNYKEAREYTQTIGKLGMVLGLDSMKRLLAQLGNPQEQLKMIHVAGTNGKGSVIAYLSEVLARAGYKTGTYTSPAVFEPLEIYRINGVNMPEETYGRLMDTVKAAVDRLMEEGYSSPTLYELETALAYLYFAQEQCQIVLQETGLGGLLDATNCIEKPLCAVLTSVSRDHMGILGNTLEEIAVQKAGIIKPGCCVVSSPQETCVTAVFRKRCTEAGAELHIVERAAMKIRKECSSTPDEKSLTDVRALQYKACPEVTPGIMGAYQMDNAATALEVIGQLRELGYVIQDCHIVEGIAETQWRGRLTKISESPLILMDGAHNEAAAKALAEVLREDYSRMKWCFVVGILADKEYETVAEIMSPYAGQVYTITPDNHRALDKEILAKVFQKNGCSQVEPCTLAGAVGKASDWCAKGTNRGILAFGSFTFLEMFCREVKKNRNRANWILSNELFLEKMEQLEQLEQNRQFCRHGWSHCMDVARGMALLNEERKLGFEKDMLYATALVHDLGRVEEYRNGIPHEQAGAGLARQILQECGFANEEIVRIVNAVVQHRNVTQGDGVLTELLKEADKKTRLCFQCKAQAQCKWSSEKMNLWIEL